MSIFKLIRAFQKAKGRSPSPSELSQLKKQADAAQPSNVLPFEYKKPFPKEIEELIERGDVTRGTAPKTTKKKPAVDPRFESAVKAQDERRRDIKDWEARLKTKLEQQNKTNAYKSALRKAKEIDKRKLSMKEVETRYKNLAKYPEGRTYLNDEIYDIERGWIHANMGNRSREELIKKIRGYIKEGHSKPDPFKKPVKEVEEGEQLEMDFTDWDSKGMKGGGLAHMLGFSNGGPLSQSQLVQMYMDEGMSYEDAVQAASASQGLPWDILSKAKGGRVPMMYGGDPGFAFEYGGSWADWNDNHKHMMPVTEYISTKLPKDRLPFRQELSGGGETGLPAIQFGPIGITPRANVGHTSGPYGRNTQKTWSDNIGFNAQIGLPGGFKIKGDYDKYTIRDRLYNPGGQFLDKRVRDDHDRYNVGIEWSKKFADGGRIGFNGGGFNKNRRNFLKLMGGLAALPIVGKYFKWAKPAAKTLEAVETSNAANMPTWFPKLVDKVLKEGKDMGGTVERQIVKQVELPGSKTKVTVEHDLNTGDTIVDIGEGKHGWEDGRWGQPTRLELQKGEWIEPEISKTKKVKNKKGVKTKDEFWVEEAEFTGDAESVKYEDVSVEKYGNHASDFTEVEKYATGKNVDKYNLKGTKKREADEWAQGRAEAEAESWADEADDFEADDFASGGLAHMLGR